MIRIELKDDQVQAALDRLARSLTDPSRVMKQIGEELKESTTARFSAGVGPDGTAWAARSDATLAAYARRGDKPSGGPLIGPSRRLSREIHYNLAEGGRSVEIGSNVEYSAVMQFGAAQGAFGARMGRTRPSEKRKASQDYFMPIPWGDIPARPFLGLSAGDRDAITTAVERWLARSATGA